MFTESEVSCGTSNQEVILMNIGGVTAPVIVDSNASFHVIDRELGKKLKNNKIKCKSQLTNTKVFAYRHTKPLIVIGSFHTTISVNDQNVDTEFIVILELC